MIARQVAMFVVLAATLCVGCGGGEPKNEISHASTGDPKTDASLAELTGKYLRGRAWDEASALAKHGDPRAIPTMIGVIDADNSYGTVYGVGYFGLGVGKLGELTRVRYSSFHDGAWWRRWWEANKTRFPEEVQNIPIPDLPKTAHGKNYTPFPEDLDTLEGKLAWIADQFAKGKRTRDLHLGDLAREIAVEGDPVAIPLLIGVIDADNSRETIRAVGGEGLGSGKLGELTGVAYSSYHDGAWWRRWWEANKTRFPEEVQNIPIPDLPKTEHGKKYTPFPEELDTLDGKLAWIADQFTKGPKARDLDLSNIAREIAAEGDPAVIPLLIGVIDADNSHDTVYGVGYSGLGFGKLGELTGVLYSSFHDGAWWRRWWEANKTRFPEEAQRIPIPDLPKTEHGKNYTPFPEQLETLDGKIAWIADQFAQGKKTRDLNLSDLAREIGEAGDPAAIPVLIGVIDADNSYDTIYGVGYFGLAMGELRGFTRVKYSEFHDGAWWRRWWEDNKTRFPEEVQNIPIPDLPKTENGKNHVPFPTDMNTFEGRAAHLRTMIREGKLKVLGLSGIAEAFDEAGDARAIPLLIGVIAADNSYASVYGVGYFGLRKLTGVKYDASHDGAWWRQWWAENKADYPAKAQAFEIPDFTEEVAQGRKGIKTAQREAVEAGLSDVPSLEVSIDGDENKYYFLIGPKAGAQPPEAGYKLAVVMPGGDGGRDFNPFIRRIFKHALGADWLIAQPIAMKWTPTQRIVWPTEPHPVVEQKFSTEAFVESVIADAKSRYPIDAKCIVTLSWSSSGPAAYAIGLAPITSVTGSFIVMSVFKPAWLPPLSNAEGRRFYIEHSPDDRVCPYSDAQTAREELSKAGAIVKSSDYQGGHGWHGDVYARIRNGLTWLTAE